MSATENNIFIIENLTHSDGKVNVTLVVNPGSDILKGHFPGQPVVPGACMLQLVKDVLETVLKNKLRLKKAQQVKFMNIVVPGDDHLRLSISFTNAEDSSFSVQASMTNNEMVCFKFQGSFLTL
ncbi:MAG TPA: hypothetical protein VFE53_12880 [Mucilaginibacter sp.]|jgi:3-hydroxyacyl-[acyl-carrier-protein] dehydratase|nr:hypothetical protein [Mucilaginibacter sp.]